jgi:hypothetical protein
LWDYSKIQVGEPLESSKFVDGLKPLANKYGLQYYGKVKIVGSVGNAQISY